MCSSDLSNLEPEFSANLDQTQIDRVGIELFCLPLRITFKRPAQFVSCIGCPSALLSWGSVGHP